MSNVLADLDALGASPGPWTLVVSEPSPYSGRRCGTVYNANGQHVCDFAGGAGKEADFRAIVHAVNHLRPLVAALRREHQKWLDSCMANEARKFRDGELASGCHACQALAALQREIEGA